MITMDMIKTILVIIVIIFIISIFYKVLWKVGTILLVVLGIIYLYKKVTEK